MKNIIYSASIILLSLSSYSQTLTWNGFPAGGTTYVNGIMTATITSSAPGFQNGTPRYYAGATVGNGQCGIAGGLALEHMFGNITSAHSTLTMDFTSGNTTNGLCGNISFRIKDINADESFQSFADWVEVSATDGNNNPIPVANITATGGSNKVITTSGNVRIVKGYNSSGYGSRSSTTCDDVTFAVTPSAGTTLKNVIVKYHPDYTVSPNHYYNFTGPLRPAFQYISISSITVNPSAGPTDVNLTSTPAACNIDDGTVTIGSVTGGSSPYQFNFNGQGLSPTTNHSGLAGGNYTVLVQDANGCTYSESITVGTEIGPTDVAISSAGATCGQTNGSVTLGTVTGGTSPYQYNFNGQGLSSTTSYSNLSGGSYTVIVEDANGCTYSESITVGTANGPTDISLSSTIAACGQTNGSVTLGTVTGGTSPYQYNFNGQGFSSITSYSNLSGGSYTVIVEDDNGCTYSESITVGTASGPTDISLSSTIAACGQSDGSVTLGTVTGGTSPYQYNFNGQGFSSTTSYPNLSGGSYTVIVEDDNGCTYSESITVGTTNGPTDIVISSTTASCNQADGSVTLGIVTGGTAPYQYNFNGQGLSSNTSYSNLLGGSYTVIVEDDNGCTYSESITVGTANGPTDIVISSTIASCGQTNGSVTLGTVTGGTAPYQYNFNGQGLSSTTSYSNLSGGNYTVIVEDVNGCTYSESITVGSISNPTDIVISFTAPSCGQSDGSVTLGAVTGGTAPYQYNFNGEGLSSTTSYSNIGGGIYTVIVEDVNGCTYSESITVSSPNSPTDIVISSTTASCGQSNGSVTLGTVTGGTAPYQYNFGGQGLSSTTSYSNLLGGIYVVVVEDANGCTYSESITVNSTNGPTDITISSTIASCGQSNGSVLLGTVTGGTAPYQYNFNGQGLSSTTSYSNLAGGNYTVIVEDANGCTYSESVTVGATSSPTNVNITVNDASCEQANGSVVIGSVTGGTAPYQYNFNGLGNSSVTNFSNLSAGNYPLVVTDDSGCQYQTLITIDNLSSGPQNVSYSVIPGTCDTDGVFIITQVDGGTSPFVFTYNGTTLTDTIWHGIPAGTHQLIITDASGCSINVPVFMPEGISESGIHIPNVFTPNGDLANDEWFVSGSCIQSFECVIVNRWGEVMIILDDITETWDGKVKGKMASTGVYFYRLDVTFADGKTEKYHGHITLVD